MERAEIEAKVKEIIGKQMVIPESRILLSDKFADDIGADSLDMVEMVMSVEEAFHIGIPDDDWEKVLTVEDVVNFVAKLKQDPPRI